MHLCSPHASLGAVLDVLVDALLDGIPALAPRDGLLAAHPLITQYDEFCVTKVVVGRPFLEFKRGYQDRFEPDAVFHLVRGQPFAPSDAAHRGPAVSCLARESASGGR